MNGVLFSNSFGMYRSTLELSDNPLSDFDVTMWLARQPKGGNPAVFQLLIYIIYIYIYLYIHIEYPPKVYHLKIFCTWLGRRGCHICTNAPGG